MNKKYRLSLLYLIKDLIISLVLGGTITAVILDVLNYIVCDATFEMSEFLSFTGASFAFGAIIGVAYRCISGGGLVEHTGVALYNTYAGIHNTFLFASAGGDYSYGATASIIGIFITILGFIYRLGCAIVVVPISLVYLCIMAIFETIFNGIPEGLGNFLDKIIPILAKLCGCIAVVLALYAINQ